MSNDAVQLIGSNVFGFFRGIGNGFYRALSLFLIGFIIWIIYIGWKKKPSTQFQ